MYDFAPFVLLVAIAFCFLFFGWLSFERENSNAGIFFIFGLLFSLLLALSPFWNPSGFPLRNIKQGTYKVAFIYVADENVNVAVEGKLDEKADERIRYYQFKKDAFEGILNPNSKKLVVVETGNFKKLRLE